MSNEAGFTPGEWRTQGCSGGGLVLVRGYENDTRQNRHPQTHLQVVPAADALLMSAAPLMYAALAALVAEWDADRLEWSENRSEVLGFAVKQPLTGGALFDDARAALAKANGTEQKTEAGEEAK